MEGNGPLVLIVLVGTVMILSGMLGGIFAGLKNRDYSFWIACTFLMPPSLLVLLALPKLKGPRPRRPSLDEEEARADEL